MLGPKTPKSASPRAALFNNKNSGDVLLSQGISPQVPSALTGLTSVFGMGTGVTLSLWSPKISCQCVQCTRGLQSKHERCKSKPSAD
jgi:hypothetical protein